MKIEAFVNYQLVSNKCLKFLTYNEDIFKSSLTHGGGAFGCDELINVVQNDYFSLAIFELQHLKRLALKHLRSVTKI